jgi:hypothetical protein
VSRPEKRWATGSTQPIGRYGPEAVSQLQRPSPQQYLGEGSRPQREPSMTSRSFSMADASAPLSTSSNYSSQNQVTVTPSLSASTSSVQNDEFDHRRIE